MVVIVGLGNPGREYLGTRHNIGERILKYFADKMGWTFKYVKEFAAELAIGNYKGKKVYLLFPHTYMNESGYSVRRLLDYYKLPVESLICVQDDASLAFGTLRLRSKGSSGGHNGLKSIEASLQTQDYARLKVGIGALEKGRNLSDHVLGRFTEDESREITDLMQEAGDVLKRLLSEDIQKVMNEVNITGKQSKKCLQKEGRESCNGSSETKPL